MHLENEKLQKIEEAKRNNKRDGKSSVNYDLMNFSIKPKGKGLELLASDAEAKFRISTRAARLYEKNNTFDPIKCVDIPRIKSHQGNAAGMPSGFIKRATQPTGGWQSSSQSAAKAIAKDLEISANNYKEATGVQPVFQTIDDMDNQIGWNRYY
jgi:hypothetical protein